MTTGKVKLNLKVKVKHKPKSVQPKIESFHTSSVRQLLEQQLNKINGGFYVPNQRYDFLRRTGEKSGFESAADVLRGIHGAVQTPKPTTEESSKKLAKTLRSREAKVLAKYAVDNGLAIDEQDFMRRWQRHGSVEGGEHRVIIDASGDVVIKQRKLWEHETAFGAIQKLESHNEIFPETKYTFKGIMNNADASLVYSQQAFRALTNESAMNVLGFDDDDKKVLKHAQIRDTIGSKQSLLDARGEQELVLNKSLTRQEVEAAKIMILNPEFEHIADVEILEHMAGKGFHPDLPAINNLAVGYMLGDRRYMNRGQGTIGKSSSMEISVSMDSDSHTPQSHDPFAFDEVQHGFSQNEINDYVLEHLDSFIDMIPFQNSHTGKRVRDLKPANFVRTMTGDIICVDPMIMPDVKSHKIRLIEELDKLK